MKKQQNLVAVVYWWEKVVCLRYILSGQQLISIEERVVFFIKITNGN
jgi:hypothetical protein